MAGRRRLAAAEGTRSPPELVGGRTQSGATTRRRAKYMAAHRRRAADGAGADRQRARCRSGHAARDVPDLVPRQRQDHHPHRPEAALRLHRLVADLTVRQQRASTVAPTDTKKLSDIWRRAME